MSEFRGGEQGRYPVDFRPQLLDALQHALPHTPGDPLKNGESVSRYDTFADNFIISSIYTPSEHEVTTTDSSQYVGLLHQALEILDGDCSQDQKTFDYLRKVAEHEIIHGKTAEQFGNSDTVSHYGVSFMVKENGEPLFWPFQFTAGPLKKIHRAWTALAPSDRSETDVRIAQDLGYTGSIDEVSKRALAEPPVVEGWRPLNDDYKRFLQNMINSMEL